MSFLDFESVPYDDSNCAGANVKTGPNLSVSVFLEGAFNENTGLMRTNLRDQNLLPLLQPYSVAPWNYLGTESVASINDFPLNAVDWVLVELKMGTPNLGVSVGTTLIERVAGILLDDGRVVAVDGFSPLSFSQISTGVDYHVLLRHRNHLDIISSGTVRQGLNMTYDFTICDTAFGNSQ